MHLKRTSERRLFVTGGLFVYAVIVVAILNRPYNVSGGLVVLHVLLAISAPLILVLLRRETPDVARIIVLALVLKLAASTVRYLVSVDVYGGLADAGRYHDAGVALGNAFRLGHFGVELHGSIIGTAFIEVLTGAIYFVTGPTITGGFLVYSWLGFWGLYFFYRAFRLALPDGDGRQYALLVFLLPSMLFWPSSIGKEGWMTLTLGLSTYGAATFLRHGARGLLPLSAGLLGASMVRPHMALAILAGLIVAHLGSRTRGRATLSPARLIGAGVLVVLLGLLLSGTGTYFERKGGLGASGLDFAAQQSSQGGSAFEPVAARSPADIPFAIVSVLFRPFLFEAGNPLAILAALETSLLLLMLIRQRRRIWTAIRRARGQPYLVFAGTYALLFCIAFSNIGNLGILARQRVQLLPFVLVFLCVPTSSASPARARVASVAEPVP